MMEEQDMAFEFPKDGMVLSIRLNREELAALTEAARFHEMKLSAYIKGMALRASRGPQVKWLHADGLGTVTVS